MTPGPIEISEADIIRRPPDWKPGGTPPGAGQGAMNPGKFLNQLKDAMKQMREISGLAKELGLDLGNLKGLGKLKDLGGKVKELQSGQGNQVSQVLLFKQFLMARYGDITVNELIEKLKEDLGDKKLSQVGKL